MQFHEIFSFRYGFNKFSTIISFVHLFDLYLGIELAVRGGKCVFYTMTIVCVFAFDLL